MTTSISTSSDIRTSEHYSPKGILGLPQELILEITSHIIISSKEPRSYIRGASCRSPLLSRQIDLGNLRLVCRYLGTLLQRKTYETLIFDFHITRWDTVADVEARLALLAQGGTPASTETKFLLIKCLDHVLEGYPFGPKRERLFTRRNFEYDEEMRSKADSVQGSLIVHLKKAVFSLINLRCILWEFDRVDALRIDVVDALSSLPHLEDLTLHFNKDCKSLQDVGLYKFHDLRSLVIVFANWPRDHNGEVVNM
ncbi:hypothetical protein BDN70DRAFT_712532 [Pholiota conissans]|uniref:F-box domain-containing protein n=1 Tax=Pholiota conissans TaxID=109636 RepID=A0A9P5Z2D5_9AGAR|nr:hypothetical protein BDN70DRAFT_712532 [Pholiota conissans]